MRKISIVDYDPNWAQQFQDLKDVFNDALKNDNIAIEHVGSTAVPGLASKPILDIDIIVDDENQLDEVTAVLVTLGYDFCGDMGIKDRYAFNRFRILVLLLLPIESGQRIICTVALQGVSVCKIMYCLGMH